ncbi:Uncharacterised protein [uncultured archaeon]|nr:Uncharacterised protein [uncultured archaeon]
MLRDLSGMMRSGSKSIFTPKPLQVSQAPKGELKENMRGWSSSKVTSQSGQESFEE